MNGICQLCKQEKELIKRSHIWPDFMYKGMYDDKGRLYVINSQDPTKHRTVQSGSYQQYIFCSECDNVRIGKLERYASNHLYRRAYLEDNEDFKTHKGPGGIQLIRCENLDYNQFKLFLLSLLWRASISTEATFANFKLAADEEEFMRTSIFENAVVEEMAFPCVLITSSGARLDKNFIAVDASNPDQVKFYINAFIYTYYLSENRKGQILHQLAIGMDNKMDMMKISPAQWNQIRASIIQATLAPTKEKKAAERGQ